MRRIKAFTLIEMSVVLVIIALLTGSVLVSKSLIRSSQINSAAADIQQYIQAVGQFQQKYGSLPGDYANATNIWGAQTTCPMAYGTTTTNVTNTCNGDGNGKVDGTSNVEGLYFWQHLDNAGLIKGGYTGVAGNVGAGDNVPGQNVPQTRMEGGGVGVWYIGKSVGQTNYYDNNYGHTMNLGAYYSNGEPLSPVMSAKEAQEFDTKYDDGLPYSGKIFTWKPAAAWDASCVTGSPAAYNVSVKGLTCSLGWISGF